MAKQGSLNSELFGATNLVSFGIPGILLQVACVTKILILFHSTNKNNFIVQQRYEKFQRRH